MTQNILNQPPAWSSKHISTQTTTVVKAAPGILRAAFVNSATNGAVVTLYDNASAASGTVLAIFTLGSVTTPQPAVVYDIILANGLTVLTGTQNADLTFTYR